MKTIIAILLLSTLPARADLPGLRLRVDQWLTNNFPVLVARQNAYRAARGRFFQGLLTHSVIPQHSDTNDVDTIPDRVAAHPTDQIASWSTAIPALTNQVLAAALKMDAYNGPNGQGWVLSIFVRFNDKVYFRVKSTGNESFRDSDWQELKE